jgi:choline dehydrogenase-like flavoprotein
MKTFSNSEEVDVVVIGTGAGGSPVLARLAQAGLKVVALEAGRHWNPDRDFATDEKEQTKLYWQDERLSAGDSPLHFGRNNSGIGVGGTTLHYTAFVPRPHPDDFNLHSEFGVGADWPLTYEDLEPYFDELEEFLGVSGPENYPWGPPRKFKYKLPSLPVNAAGQLMLRGAEKLGIKCSPAPNAALSKKYQRDIIGWRSACTNRGFCESGCTTGAKASMDVTYIRLALHYGAEIRPECFATKLELNTNGKIKQVVYTYKNNEYSQSCKAVFLCAGAVETPRLLLLNELANTSGQVGKYFMAHTSLQVWGRFKEEVRPNKGIPAAIISEDFHRPTDADFAGGYLLQSIGIMPVTYASQYARATSTWGKQLKEHMLNYNFMAGINMHGDCLPYESNCIKLSDELDTRGLPKPVIYFSNGDNERKMEDHSRKIMYDIWEAAGAIDIWEYPRNSHTLGTCRMGKDAATGVVDAYGRSFDIPNLYISDGSVFTTALSVNPALTIMAIALRNADHFLEQLKNNHQ